MSIHFFNEDSEFKIKKPEHIISWLKNVIEDHKFQLKDLNYIFCSDQYLLQVNQDYLNHDYFTDIITFDNSEKEDEIEGDIFISIDRVLDNSQKMGTNFDTELYRVMAHGLLHLLGFDDKTNSDKTQMREKEDTCLSLLKT